MIKGKKKNWSARHPDALPARASRIAKSEERYAKAEHTVHIDKHL